MSTFGPANSCILTPPVIWAIIIFETILEGQHDNPICTAVAPAVATQGRLKPWFRTKWISPLPRRRTAQRPRRFAFVLHFFPVH